MSNKKNHYSAKGYYIALVLCAAAVGVTGYLYYRNTSDTEVQQPAAAVEEQTQENRLPVAATAPNVVEESTAPAQTEATVGQPKKPARTASPVEGETVAGYSMECLSYNETTRDWRVHAGLDLAAEPGTAVKAAADGEVYTVYEDDQMGMTVVIRHDGGYTTHYASLAEEIPVKAGDQVKLGDTIGTVGSTALLESALGDHVCFRVTCDGEAVDPAEFLS